MGEISDLATSFKAKSQQQAADIEQTGKAALTELERRWKAALSASGKRMADDIQSHNAKIQRALLWSWAGPLAACLAVLAGLSGVTWWQGQELVATVAQVKEAKATLAELEKRGGVGRIYDCEGQPCIAAEPSKYELDGQPLYLLKRGP
jgi:hypothetical protein